MTVHRLVAVSFRLGIADCRCGTEVRGSSPEDLRDAYYLHRRAVGASNENVTIAYSAPSNRTASELPWNGTPSGVKPPRAT